MYLSFCPSLTKVHSHIQPCVQSQSSENTPHVLMSEVDNLEPNSKVRLTQEYLDGHLAHKRCHFEVFGLWNVMFNFDLHTMNVLYICISET